MYSFHVSQNLHPFYNDPDYWFDGPHHVYNKIKKILRLDNPHHIFIHFFPDLWCILLVTAYAVGYWLGSQEPLIWKGFGTPYSNGETHHINSLDDSAIDPAWWNREICVAIHLLQYKTL